MRSIIRIAQSSTIQTYHVFWAKWGFFATSNDAERKRGGISRTENAKMVPPQRGRRSIQPRGNAHNAKSALINNLNNFVRCGAGVSPAFLGAGETPAPQKLVKLFMSAP